MGIWYIGEVIYLLIWIEGNSIWFIALVHLKILNLTFLIRVILMVLFLLQFIELFVNKNVDVFSKKFLTRLPNIWVEWFELIGIMIFNILKFILKFLLEDLLFLNLSKQLNILLFIACL